MANIVTAKIGGTSYNITQAPADKQKKLLSLIGAKIALNSAYTEDKIDSSLLLGALLSTEDDIFEQIETIVLYQTVEKNGGSVVEVGDFQNRITEYYQLVAAAIEANLSDFFTYLDSEKKSASPGEEKH